MEDTRETVDPNFPIFREAQSSQVRQQVREGKSGGAPQDSGSQSRVLSFALC